MEDLIAFLRARLDEDEATTRAATSGPWRYDPSKHWRKPGTSWFEEAVFAGPSGADATCVAGTGETNDRQSMADARHIARHDPARVLAEVDAKRRIMREYDDARTAADVDPRDASAGVALLAFGIAIRALAAPYADHPDYRVEWRP